MACPRGAETVQPATRARKASAVFRYGVALVITGCSLLIRWPLYPWLEGGRPYLTLFGGVAIVAWLVRWRIAVLAAVVGFIAANYFLVLPRSAFVLNATTVIEFAAYSASIGLVILFAEMMHRAKDREAEQKDLVSVTLASIGDAVIATDVDGRITFLNSEAERLTAWLLSEATGRPLSQIFRIINERTLQEAQDPVATVLRTGNVVGLANHTVLISKDGTRTPIDDSAAPIRAPSGSVAGVVLVFRDVTTQRRAQEATARLATIIEYSGDAIFTKDLYGIVQTWNVSAERLFGYQADEIVGKPVTILFPPDRLQEENHILSLLRSGRPCERFETVRVTKAGRHVPVSVSVSPLKNAEGEIIGASKIVHDISDIVAARNDLVREKELLATTLASIGDGVIVTDTAGRVTFLNAEAEQLTGWKNAEATGQVLQDIFRIVNEQTRQTVENPVEKVLRLGTVVGLANHTVLIAKDGREIPIDDSGAPIRTPDGALFGVVLVFRDFSEHKKATAALEQAKRDAEHASRAKDQFLAMLSHELRTPLTPVLMTATSLEADSRIAPKVREQLAMMRRNIELEARLIDDLLDVTRIEHGKFELRAEPVDIHAAIEHALGISASELNAKSLTVTKRFDATDHFCRGDAARLHEVFWNILRNAVKFTAEHGKIDIHTRNDQHQHLIIEFRDTGIGIEPELQSRIFDVFEQGAPEIRARYGGLGLGLAICKRVIRLHDGTIEVHSHGSGCGSTFTVTLNALDQSTVEVLVRPVAQTLKRARAKILVVEDHKDTAEVMRRILKDAGCVVTHCTTVARASTLAAEKKFDLVICDIGLPDGSGLDLMRHLRAAHGLNGIALSGFGTQEDVAASKAAGFTMHLTKPVDLIQLRAAIGELVSPDSAENASA